MALHDDFFVVTAYFNPWRWKSRKRLYEEFAAYVADSGAKLVTLELAFGERPFEVTSSDNPRHIQMRTSVELWHKERMLNLAIQRLPAHWQYVAWVDADVRFTRPDWPQETVHLLQHYAVLQMFADAIDLDPEHQFLQRHIGFVKTWEEYGRPSLAQLQTQLEEFKAQKTVKTASGLYDQRLMGMTSPPALNGHPGFAWAARRQAIEQLGGLFDTAILGAGDRHMSLALAGAGKWHMQLALAASNNASYKALQPGYCNALYDWQDRADEFIRGNMGYMPGTLWHYWHGRKKDRRYKDRWQILIEHGFDPRRDLKQDSQGLWQWSSRSPRLWHQIRDYFASRNEDSIDL